MIKIRNQRITQQRVVLDGTQYEGCTFDKCQIVYRGGDIPSLVGNTFHECQWALEGAADRTVGFMRSLFHGGLPELIERTFDDIRRNAPKTG